MRIKTVTISGASDCRSRDLQKVSDEWGCVEWGILCSRSREGTPRYPERMWTKSLDWHLKLSAHLCGQYVRDIFNEKYTWNEDYPFSKVFSRIQINFAKVKVEDIPSLGDFMRWNKGFQFILPDDGVNRGLAQEASVYGSTSTLVDRSGGQGILSDWVCPDDNVGFAGGLTPANLREELRKIEAVAGDRVVWIDVESGVRTDDRLDFYKVNKFIEAASSYF